jgi:hypothetical protein
MRGRISPKVMAVMIRNAVALLVTMLVSRAAGAVGAIATNTRRPVAAFAGTICETVAPSRTMVISPQLR